MDDDTQRTGNTGFSIREPTEVARHRVPKFIVSNGDRAVERKYLVQDQIPQGQAGVIVRVVLH